MKLTVEVDGFTYEARSLAPGRGLHVRGPLEYRRPTQGFYFDGDWCDDAGPQGRLDSPRHRRWWKAAHQLVRLWDERCGRGGDR